MAITDAELAAELSQQAQENHDQPIIDQGIDELIERGIDEWFESLGRFKFHRKIVNLLTSLELLRDDDGGPETAKAWAISESIPHYEDTLETMSKYGAVTQDNLHNAVEHLALI